METASPQRMTIIILGAVLLAAVAVGAVIYFAPTLNLTPQDDVGLAPLSPEGEVGFDTAVLTHPDYAALDTSLFARGLLPVQPPATAGKQNPFQ